MEVITIISIGFLIILSMCWNYSKYRLLFSPFMLIGAICFLVQVVGPLYWKVIGQRDYWGIPIMDYIIQNELIFGLGYISFWLTFATSKPKRIRINSPIIYQNENGIIIDYDIKSAYFLWLFFLALYIIYLMMRGRSILSQLTLGQAGVYSEDILSESDMKIWFLLVALDMMIPLAAIVINTPKSKYRYLVYIITALLTVSSGKRHLMLDALLAPIIVNYSIRRKKPNLAFTALIAIIAYLLVGWIGAMRSVFRAGVGELVSYNSSSAWAAIMVNLEVFKMLCIYIPRLKSFSDFGLGTEYIRAFIQLIPSIVFPIKGEIISALTIGTAREAIGSALLKSGIAGTLWSGLYANGWIFGVVIGMALLGKWARRMMYRLYTDRVTYIAEYAVMTSFTFQLLTRAFSSSVQTWFALVVPLYLLRRLSNKKR